MVEATFGQPGGKTKQQQLQNERKIFLPVLFIFCLLTNAGKKADQNCVKINRKIHPSSLSEPLLSPGKNTPFPTSAPVGFLL